MEYYHDLKKKLCRELENYAKDGKLSAGDLEVIDKLTHSIKSLVTIIAMEDSGYSGEYSGARRRDSMGRYADNGPGYNRYYDGGSDGYSGRRMYSRDEGKSHMIHQLEDLMQQAGNQEERQALQQALSRLQQM